MYFGKYNNEDITNFILRGA